MPDGSSNRLVCVKGASTRLSWMIPPDRKVPIGDIADAPEIPIAITRPLMDGASPSPSSMGIPVPGARIIGIIPMTLFSFPTP